MLRTRNVAFDKLLEKATSDLLMEPDWDMNIQICDIIRGRDASPKYATSALSRKLKSDNPHVIILSLSLLESLMKNCGTPMHDEVCRSEFVEGLLSYTHTTEEIRLKIFELIQNWEFAFKNNETYQSLHNAFSVIKKSGSTLPPFVESEAMFAAEAAPGWKDGDSCHRCKSTFTTFRRKHHCRNCGNIFCGNCTLGRALIPKFGIEKEVRVCETCAHSLSRSLQHEHLNTSEGSKMFSEAEKVASRDRELKLREDEELQLALTLSASEAEARQKMNREVANKPFSSPLVHTLTPLSTQPSTTLTPQLAGYGTITGNSGTTDVINNDGTELDAELAHYLNRNYWIDRAATANCETESVYSQNPVVMPSAPVIFNPPTNPDYEPSLPDTSIENADVPTPLKGLKKTNIVKDGVDLPGVPPLTSTEREEFLAALRKSVDIFVNRMRAICQRGRPISNDSTVQSLFPTLHTMYAELIEYMKDLEFRRGALERMQDNVVQIREAREALNALRRDHAEKRRLQEEEEGRRRREELMRKMESLRLQKQQVLASQNRMALEQLMQYQQQQLHQHQMYGLQQYAGYCTDPCATGMVPPNTQLPCAYESQMFQHDPTASHRGVLEYTPPLPPAYNYTPPPLGSQPPFDIDNATSTKSEGPDISGNSTYSMPYQGDPSSTCQALSDPTAFPVANLQPSGGCADSTKPDPLLISFD